VFAFTMTDDVRSFDVYDVSRRLRERGWLVPAYSFPRNREDLDVLRVVRTGIGDLLDLLLDLEDTAAEVQQEAARRRASPSSASRSSANQTSSARRRTGRPATSEPSGARQRYS
jgi:glutamate/tyrosine decarboxylase-like PLP-dependent enzyme